jgi:predicted RND superfamily exporter protein
LQYFGLLISLSMAGSGLSALTFLPVILILAHRKNERHIAAQGCNDISAQ